MIQSSILNREKSLIKDLNSLNKLHFELFLSGNIFSLFSMIENAFLLKDYQSLTCLLNHVQQNMNTCISKDKNDSKKVKLQINWEEPLIYCLLYIFYSNFDDKSKYLNIVIDICNNEQYFSSSILSSLIDYTYILITKTPNINEFFQGFLLFAKFYFLR